MPYADGVLPAEVILVFILVGIEALRLFFGRIFASVNENSFFEYQNIHKYYDPMSLLGKRNEEIILI